MTSKKAKSDARKALNEADNFMLVSYSPDTGVKIQSSVGLFAFTMLGAIELAKQQLMTGFKDRAELEQKLVP